MKKQKLSPEEKEKRTNFRKLKTRIKADIRSKGIHNVKCTLEYFRVGGQLAAVQGI